MATISGFESAIDAAFEKAAQPPAQADQAAQPSETTALTPQPPTQTPDVAPAQPPVETSADGETLLSAEEEAALQGKTPEDRIKAFQSAFTRKTQGLAEQRKALEDLAAFREALESDPQAAMLELAKHYGVDLKPPVAAATQPAVTPKTLEAEAAELLKAHLAPENHWLADQLAPAFAALATRAAEQKIAPLAQQQERAMAETARTQSTAEWQKFCGNHKDAAKYEAAMVKLGQQLQPTTAMDPQEYLELLYAHVTRNRTEAQQVQKTIDCLASSAAHAEPTAPGVSPQRVTKAPPTGDFNAKFEQCFADAVAGTRYGE